MHSHVLKSVCRVLAFVALAAVPVSMAAQNAPTPAYTYADAPSRWDMFAGYSYLSPHGTMDVVQPDGSILTTHFSDMKSGLIQSGSYFFNKYVGVQAEEAAHDMWVESAQSKDSAMSIQGGMVFRAPMNTITPFVHGLGGGAIVGGPQGQRYTWGPTLTAGGGMDWE